MGSKERTLTLNQQKLEEYIDDHEDGGRFLNAMGLISDEELAAGIHKDEEFRVSIELDKDWADVKAEELEVTGEVSELTGG